MAIKSRKFTKGIRLKGSTDAATLEGEIRLDPSALKFKAYVDSAERSIVTEDQVQTVTNKDIDADNNTISNIETDNLKAGVLITDISTATSDTELPSALAVKTALDGQNEASEIDYDNSTSGLTATDVQAAIDEVEGRVDTAETGLSDHLADAVDAHDASAISNVPTGNLIATDVQGALDELQTEIDALPSKTETLQNKTLDSTNTISGSIETPTRSDVKQDTEANLETYAGSAADGQIVFATDTQKMYQIVDNELQAIGGGGATSFEIEQVAHGFAVGEGVYHNGTTWVKAQSDDADTLAYFAIVEVIDVDNFIAADFGRIEVPAHGYTVGEFYFQSDSVAGQATNVEPSSFSNPLFYVEDANTLQVKVYRPAVVGQDVVLDELSDVSAPSPTDGQALIYDNGNSRWEAKDIATSATDITYDNSTSGLTATDSQAAIDEVEGRVDTLEAATVALDDLSDVSVAAPNEGEVLTYNSGSGDWESAKAPSSAINYIENSDFEVDTSGYTGDTNLVISRITSGQLRGLGSLQIAKAAADASGEQVYVDFTVDSADLAKKLTISFDYDASDANYSDGDMKVLIIQDPSGTPVTIRPNGEDLLGGKGTHYAQFQTDSTETEYRLVIEQDSTQALAVNIVLDNVSVGPQVISHGTIVTDWEEYTPIMTGGGSAVMSAIEGRYRRVGDSVEIGIRAVGGVAGSGGSVLKFSIPTGLMNDASKVKGKVGVGEEYNLGTASNTWAAFAVTSDNGNAVQMNNVGTGGAYVGSHILTTTQIYLRATIPIQGWSSNAKMSEDFSGRDIALQASGNDGETVTSSEDIPFKTIAYDTTASWSNAGNTGNNTNDAFTVPESGYYDIDLCVRVTASSSFQVNLYVDGTQRERHTKAAASIVTNAFFTGYYLNKGEVVTFRTDQTLTLTNDGDLHRLRITKRSSAQTILENETVAAIYRTDNSTSQTINTSSSVLIYEDIDHDTHNAYDTSTGVYTVPASGIYSMNGSFLTGSVAFTAGGGVQLEIRVNGVNKKRAFNRAWANGSYSHYVEGNVILKLEKGDEVEIFAYSSTTTGPSTSPDYNVFSIARIK